MRARRLFIFAAGGLLILTAGCSNHNKPQQQKVDTAPFKTALDNWYQSHPACAWQNAKTFPVDIDEHKPNPAEKDQLDAFVDAGLLTEKRTRKAVEQDHHRHYEHVYEYSLTDKGRQALAADNAQAGAGNFCVGSPSVTGIDNYTPSPNTSRYNVTYHFRLGSVPDWANNAKVRTAFPNLAAEAGGGNLMGLATLSKSGSGWDVSGVQALAVPSSPQ